MKVVLDTNVFVSGVFFGGVPGRILEGWRDGRLTLLVSVAILDEYQRVGRLLANQRVLRGTSDADIALAIYGDC